MNKSRIFYFGFCLVSLVLIIWRYQVIDLRIENNELSKYNDLEQDVLFTGTVVKEQDIRENHIKLTVEPEKLKGQGRILVTVSRYPEYKYGDKLKIIGNANNKVKEILSKLYLTIRLNELITNTGITKKGSP